MNPYATQLGQKNADEVIARTPGRLQELLTELTPRGLTRSYAPGKWNGRTLLVHLADCEIAFAFRLRQALAERNHVIQPFDQDAWAEVYSSNALEAAAAVQVFSAVRSWNIALLEAAGPEARDRAVTHPERGEMTVQTIVETMAGHDLNHLGQLDKIAAA